MNFIAINVSNRVIDKIQPQQHKVVSQKQADVYARTLPNDIKLIEVSEIKDEEVETEEVEEEEIEEETEEEAEEEEEEVEEEEEEEESEEESEEEFLDGDNAQVVHGMTDNADITIDFNAA